MPHPLNDAPPAVQLADWRCSIAEAYARTRSADDPAAAWTEWRADRDRLFADHPQSPLAEADRDSFSGLRYFDYDPALRLLVDLEPIAGQAEDWEIGQDGTMRLHVVARTRGLADTLGAELQLYWIAGYGGGLFMPFADATSGRETYGGGRYLLDTMKGADLGRSGPYTVLDFNFAYYPSCAHNPAWTCPLTPPGNRLPAPVEAGQRG